MRLCFVLSLAELSHARGAGWQVCNFPNQSMSLTAFGEIAGAIRRWAGLGFISFC